ncbi:hypothetical protein [Pseudaestuariivita sp.]|uniref:hypothetical protein n=1 Tax=Pseudaestuariivita sp. TaxID=2211669 RepID=UPI0040582873
MKRTALLVSLTVAFLALLDFGVAQALRWAEGSGRLGSLVQYFEYGRSVPGKHARWAEAPGTPGNLYEVAWRPDILAMSKAEFAQGAADASVQVRSYSMSFVENILGAATAQSDTLRVDSHSGPSAPPNFTYGMFLEDRANRRAGEVVVLGFVSSAVPGMAAFTNATWIFEQPAPFTYPVFVPGESGLVTVAPVVGSLAELEDPAQARLWQMQQARYDPFYSAITHGATWLDASPFARLVRRAWATAHVENVRADVLHGQAYPYEEVLRGMVTEFAATARADGQEPWVFLIQTRDPRDADLLALLQETLEAEGINYLASAEHIDLRDPTNFISDGHYTPEVDAMFGQMFLEAVGAR